MIWRNYGSGGGHREDHILCSPGAVHHLATGPRACEAGSDGAYSGPQT